MVHFDVIVIGVGGVGSATLYHLARRGVRAVGLDRFAPGHDRGSSHGQTRIIRLAYFEHADYVPLLLRAYELWTELEQAVGQKLFHQVGLLGSGPPEGMLFPGIQQSAKEHGLPLEQLSADEVHRRWPGFRVPENHGGLFEQRAGYLLVEDCVQAHAEAAVQAGADLLCGVQVLGWKADGQGVTVETDNEVLTADRLVIAAGAWAGDLLRTIGVPFQVLRKPLFWYRNNEPSYRQDAGCPCFFFESPAGLFYGFPQINESGVKLAEHTGGLPVADPLNVDRSLNIGEQQQIESFLVDYLPGVSCECTAHAVCMYTMSPDGHFIVGRHRRYPQVAFAAGLSGHGFKFTSVLGEILAELSLDGHTRHSIEFLSQDRFGQ